MRFTRSFGAQIAVFGLAFSACKPNNQPQQVEHREIATGAPAPPQYVHFKHLLRAHAQPLNQGAWLATLNAYFARSLANAALRATIVEQLQAHQWAVPIGRIQRSFKVSKLIPLGGEQWLVAIDTPIPTVFRWDADTGQVGGILFPSAGHSTRGISVSPMSDRLVIDRDGLLLLVNARSLEPIQELGEFPEMLDHDSVISWTADGLLFCHPIVSAAGISWIIRDHETGDSLRASPAFDRASLPLAAHLDRSKLQLLARDACRHVVPLALAEPDELKQFPAAVELTHAIFSPDGEGAWVRRLENPHLPAIHEFLDFSSRHHAEGPIAQLLTIPWSRLPNPWLGQFFDDPAAHIRVVDCRFIGQGVAAVTQESPITAAAWAGNSLYLADERGISNFQLLPKIVLRREPHTIEPHFLPGDDTVLTNFIAVLTGYRADPNSGELEKLAPEDRVKLAHCETWDRLHELFPTLDFTDVFAAFSELRWHEIAPETWQTLDQRLAAASRSTLPTPEQNQWLQAMETNDLEGIAQCLNDRSTLPATLRRLSHIQLAWFSGARADALAAWDDTLSDYRWHQRREDWHGWERLELAAAIQPITQAITAALESLQIPPDASTAQMEQVAKNLLAPETLRWLGRKRLAAMSLAAAQRLAADAGIAELTVRLAQQAKLLGADAVKALRAEAIAHTHLQHHEQALACWLELLGNYPLHLHEPGDYAESAYTAFENSRPDQAMEILRTGISRFPDNAKFALRAGWIALLTAHAEEAHAFLLAGERIGYLSDQLENATLLLAISAAQTGRKQDALIRLGSLKTIDPAWRTLEPLDSLDWPEEFKQALRALTL